MTSTGTILFGGTSAALTLLGSATVAAKLDWCQCANASKLPAFTKIADYFARNPSKWRVYSNFETAGWLESIKVYSVYLWRSNIISNKRTHFSKLNFIRFANL